MVEKEVGESSPTYLFGRRTIGIIVFKGSTKRPYRPWRVNIKIHGDENASELRWAKMRAMKENGLKIFLHYDGGAVGSFSLLTN